MKTPFGTELTGDATRSKRRRWLPIALGGIVLTLLVGAAAAASIQINSGDPIEFGQGKEIATACDTSIDASLSTASFGTSITDLAFRVDSLDLTNVDLVACDGKLFTVTFRKADGTPAGVCDFGVLSGPDQCVGPDYHAAGDAVVKFTFTECNEYGACTITYYPNPSQDYGGDKGIAYVDTNLVTNLAAGDGSLYIDPVWYGADTVYWTELPEVAYLIRADLVSGFTVETSG